MTEIPARLSALREAGAKLRRRPARETLGALATVVDGFRDPGSRWRQDLLAELPEATGFTRETVREGLAAGFDGWSGEDLLALVERELGSPEALDGAGGPGRSAATGFDTTAVLLAGSIPMPTFVALVAPLALRSPVLAKAASRDPVTPFHVARAVAEVDAELGSCVEAAVFPGSDPRARDLLEADCVVATGSDETVATVAARVRPPRRLVAYGHRLSVAALGPEASKGEALAAAASAFARDVSLWDQLGCLSPLALYAVGGPPAAERVAEALATALEEAERRWPRGRVEVAAAAAIANERAEAELRAAAGRDVSIHGGDAWTVVREEDALPRAAPLHRFARVHPVADEAALLEAIRPLGPHLAAVGIGGFASNEIARALAGLGASRVCPIGRMQAPPLRWRHDNRGVLLPLARLADLEL